MSRRAARRFAVSIAALVLPAVALLGIHANQPAAHARPVSVEALAQPPTPALAPTSVAAAADYVGQGVRDFLAAEAKAQADARAEADRQAAAAAAAAAAAKAKPKPAPTYTPPAAPVAPGEVPPLLARIRGCESGNNYTRVNQSGSTASGAYQILDSTWRGTHDTGGWRELVPGAEVYWRAMDAPPEIQDAVAMAAFGDGNTAPWKASRFCWAA